MKIVIDIPEAKFKALQIVEKRGLGIGTLERAVLNGTPLPKGHGRLIDADALEYFCNTEKCIAGEGIGCNYCQYHIITEYEIYTSHTIIEADKGDQE